MARTCAGLYRIPTRLLAINKQLTGIISLLRLSTLPRLGQSRCQLIPWSCNDTFRGTAARPNMQSGMAVDRMQSIVSLDDDEQASARQLPESTGLLWVDCEVLYPGHFELGWI